MARFGRGLICLSLTEERLNELRLPMMVQDNTSRFQTAFTVSIDARKGVTTGISAADRAATILTAIEDTSQPEDLVSPGHIFPLRAQKGGVLVRTGQTEGSVDLSRLAGPKPAGVICEIMNEDGSMARMPELKVFSEKHGVKVVTIADLIKYRLSKESLVRNFRRAIDARRRSAVVLIYTIDCDVGDEAAVLARPSSDAHVRPAPDTTYRPVAHAPADFYAEPRPRPVVIGFGPCGIFAALVLAQMGLRPIVLERGKRVRERTKDTWALWRKGVLDPDSNVQFGEGGAGTFSDGKLWSQISDPRHLTRKVLTEFVKAGAPEEILYVSKPHIGTFRLVRMVEKMRAEIESLGGDVRFEHKLVDVHLEGGALRGITVAHPGAPRGEEWAAEQVVLAPGHSARETFAMLYERVVYMQAKPFSIGFHVEHPRGVIDRARYGRHAGHPILGAADYKLVHHARNARSVYSFCMCPGGTVVAATSEPGHVVTNGMSHYSRAERNANAGIVVGIDPGDYALPGHVDERHGGHVHPLDGIAFQRRWEQRAFDLGGGDYCAPGQLVGDFLKRQRSGAFGNVLPSYKPGVRLADLAQPDGCAIFTTLNIIMFAE